MSTKQYPYFGLFLACFVGVLLLFAGCDKIDGMSSPTGPSGTPNQNLAPIINCIDCSSTSVKPNGAIKIFVNACDPENDALTYEFTTPKGTVHSNNNIATWVLPSSEGHYSLNVTVSDGHSSVSDHVDIFVIDYKVPDKDVDIIER